MPSTRVHAVVNQKGGVGKTTLAMNLAAVTHEALTRNQPDDGPRPVMVANTDTQGSAVWWSARVAGLPFDYVQITDPGDLADLRAPGRQHVFVDTPGSLEDEKTLRAVLQHADDVIVPITPEPLAFDPTTRTVQILESCAVPYIVVVNAWDPREGMVYLTETAAFIDAQGWRKANNVIRRYRIHTNASADGKVCTQYGKSRVAQEAREDFLYLALELGYGGDKAGA